MRLALSGFLSDGGGQGINLTLKKQLTLPQILAVYSM